MAAELQDAVVFANAIRHFLGMSSEYAREYVARLPIEPAELLVRALGRLGWWLPDETLSAPDRLSVWLFREGVTCLDFEGRQEIHRPETPEERLTDAINRLTFMATSSDVPRDSCAAMAAFVKNVRLTLKRKELPLGLSIIRAGNPADFQFDPLALIRFDGECLCQSLNSAGERLNLQPHPIDWTPSNGDPHQTVDRSFQDLGELMDRWIDDLKSAIRERGERLSGKVQREPVQSVRRDPEFVEERLRNLKRTWEQEIEALSTGWGAVAAGKWAGHRRISADTYLRFGLVTFTTSGKSSPHDSTVAAWHPTILAYLQTLGVDPSPVDDLFRRFLKGDLTDKRAVRREAKRAFLQLDIAIERAGQQYEDGETEIGRSDKLTSNQSARNSNQESDPEFVFRRDGDGYFIRGFGMGEHFSAEGAKGFHDLFRIVQQPGIGVPLWELDCGEGGEIALLDSHSRQPAADRGTIQELEAKRWQLKADIEEAESDIERNELQSELEKLETAAKTLFGLHGKARDLNNPLNKLRPKVLGRLKTAIKRIHAKMPTLADHFSVAVKTEDGNLLYSPGIPDCIWVTTPK